MQRAIETYDINVIGLTLSRSQRDYAESKLAKVPTHRHVEVRLQGWEEFEGQGRQDRLHWRIRTFRPRALRRLL